MGCGQSKIENEEAVSRCKERKLYMKEAMSSRNAFAAAHSTYATYLKYAGAALTGYASGEGTARFPNTVNVAQQAMPPPPLSSVGAESIDKLRPPPPPDRLDTLSPPLQRAATMPEIKIQKPEGPGSVATTIAEEEEGNESDDEDQHSRLRRRSGSNRNASVLEDVGAPPPVPRIPPEEVPMPSQIHESPYDYFFSPDPMHTTTLSERLPAEEVGVTNEEIERKPVDEKPKKTDDKTTGDTGGGGGEGKGFESVVVERPPVKRGKQGGSVAEGKRVMKGKFSLQDIFLLLDDHFLKASETAHEVSKMLEATRLHYHSNFADNRGHIDHSSRVMRVITWNRSFKGLNDHDEVKDDFDSEEHETHATVLDKLLAWEKKLYDEVKAGELMKFEYQRKVASLNRLKKRGTNSDALEKAKAAVSHLHTRYIVDMQSMDSTVFEINRLRDEQLYPKLVQLVIGMATMWQAMREHHERQSELVKDLADVRVAQSQSPGGTSDHHHECTDQLLMVVQVWHSQFQKLVNHQKGYINALNKWLKLNLIPIESSLREKVSSPPRIQKPPIQELLLAWHNELDKLPDEDARTAIGSFAAAIKAIYDLQAEEIKQRQKCEETRKELSRKSRQFDDWYQKYMQRMVPGELDPEGSDPNAQKELGERQFVVDQLKKKLEDEEEAYRGLCQHVREKSLGTFQNQLPLLFRKMADFADECSKMYRNVTSKSKLQRSSQSSS